MMSLQLGETFSGFKIDTVRWPVRDITIFFLLKLSRDKLKLSRDK